MTGRKSYLLNRTVNPPVLELADIVRDISVEQLDVIELQWKPSRDDLKRVFIQEGIELEHQHWDWRRKRNSLVSGRHRVIAIRTGSIYQGLIALLDFCRTSKTNPSHEILYVDYIESAPHNIRMLTNRTRYGAVGQQLLCEAIVISQEMGFQGRIGLHSLPQSESFYRDRLGMIDLGNDQNYDNLRYFEYDEFRSRLFLNRVMS